MKLGEYAKGLGYRLERFESLATTSGEAMDRARAGEPGRLWIVAREQTAGRGRQGRPWSSPPGNLHASLLLIDAAPTRVTPQLGFVAGVALLDALDAIAPGVPCSLKWPNDALSGGAKLAGVLVEGATLPGGRFACVIGVGVNCATSPRGLAYRTTSLAELGSQLTPDGLLPALADMFARRLELWRSGAGFAQIRDAWLARAAGLGAPMRVEAFGRRLEGVFETIDEHGRLILSTSSGRETVEAADVFPAETAPERLP